MKQRTIIITGSSRGIGLATAIEFLKNGDHVTVFCRHDDHMQEAVKILKQHGDDDQILITTGDVSKGDDVKRIIKETLDRFGKIDVLINNAGQSIWKLLEETSEEEWDSIIDTNLKGAYLFMHEVVPVMKGVGSGIVINISSGLGVSGGEKYSAYSASKFGMIGLTQVLAEETKGTDIKSYAILPGAVATKLHLDVHPWEDPEKMMTPQYVGGKIFKAAEGKLHSGSSIEVYG